MTAQVGHQLVEVGRSVGGYLLVDGHRTGGQRLCHVGEAELLEFGVDRFQTVRRLQVVQTTGHLVVVADEDRSSRAGVRHRARSELVVQFLNIKLLAMLYAGLLGLGLGLVFLALSLFKAKVKVTSILPNTVYLGIITLTVHWYTSVIGTAIVRRQDCLLICCGLIEFCTRLQGHNY